MSSTETPKSLPPRLAFDGFRVDLRQRLLTADGEPVPITPTIFELLLAFLERPGDLLHREELFERVWPGKVLEDANLTQSVFVLRKLLRDTGPEHRLIVTEPGRGYRFVGRVVPADEDLPLHPDAPKRKAGRRRPRRRALVAGAVAVLSVLSLALALRILEGDGASEPVGGIETVAVLPFTALGTEEPSVLGLGLADAVATRLAADRDLVVRPVSTVLDYLRPGALPTEVGRRLQVDAILEGTLLRSGETLRINVRLTSTDDERVLWAASLRLPAGDEFEIQDAVASRVTAAVIPGSTGTGPASDAGPFVPRDTSFRAYEAVLEGRYHMAARDRDGFLRARAAYRRALESDPGHAPAWSGLAAAELLLGFYRLGELPPLERYRVAADAARRAVELDPSLSTPHTLLGMLAMVSSHDLDTAERHMLRALDAEPGARLPHHWYAWVLFADGRTEEAIHQIEVAYHIDPMSLIVRSARSLIAYYGGDNQKALDGFDAILAINDRFGRAHLNRGLVLEQLGRFEEAEAAFRRAAEVLGETDEVRASIAHLYGHSGRREAWEALMAEWNPTEASPGVTLFAYAGAGDRDRVLSLLERAVERREVWVWDVRHDPRLDPFRADPRFERAISTLIGRSPTDRSGTAGSRWPTPTPPPPPPASRRRRPRGTSSGPGRAGAGPR